MERIVYDRMAAHDSTHWWYRARRDILADYVARGEARPAHRRAMADHLAVYAEAEPA